jgi:iron complex transport system ATP-binding protein
MTNTPIPLLDCQKLQISVAGRQLVDGLDLPLNRGQFVAVLGKNGSGKTLTLKTMAGLRPCASGAIDLDGHALVTLRRSAIASKLAFLTQHDEDTFPSTVLETVLVGRHPHIKRFAWESARDFAIARATLAKVDMSELEDRWVETLSGGERRRLAIAQVLTQQAQVYLLDEPINHLDPQHELDILQLFRDQADQGAAVAASLHDVNLAARFADRSLLLFGDGRWLLGDSGTVLTEQNLSELYATRICKTEWQDRDIFITAGNQQSPTRARTN